MGKTDVVISIGSTKERGGMHSAVEMEMREMVQKGRKNFDIILKKCFPDFINLCRTIECTTPLKGQHA